MTTSRTDPPRSLASSRLWFVISAGLVMIATAAAIIAGLDYNTLMRKP